MPVVLFMTGISRCFFRDLLRIPNLFRLFLHSCRENSIVPQIDAELSISLVCGIIAGLCRLRQLYIIFVFRKFVQISKTGRSFLKLQLPVRSCCGDRAGTI